MNNLAMLSPLPIVLAAALVALHANAIPSYVLTDTVWAVPRSHAQQLNPEWAVVLTETQSQPFWRPRLCNRAGPGAIDGTWPPDTETIARLESALVGALQAALDASRLELERSFRASDYYRQYAGYVVKGKRFVYINGFHMAAQRGRRAPDWWRTEAARPCDGGALFFGADFDVESGQVTNVLFN